jgi:hypothetical protein
MEKNYYDPMLCGTESYHILSPLDRNKVMKATDSVVLFCKEKSAFWCFDVMFSYYPNIKKEEFVTFHFDVENDKCKFYATNGNDKILVKQNIPYTDLDVSVKFFYTNNVLMFPSDY